MQIPEPLLAQRWEEVGCFALCFFPQPSRLQLLVLLNFFKAGKNITYLVSIVLSVCSSPMRPSPKRLARLGWGAVD